MDKEGLRYVQTFISDWLSNPMISPDMHSIEYYRGPNGEIRFFADFRFNNIKIGFRNRVENPYELSYFGNKMKVLKKEISIHWDENPEPDYIDKENNRCMYTFITDIDDDLEGYILLPINPKDYKFADNIHAIVFDNIKNKIIIGISDLDNLEGCEISFVAYKVSEEDEKDGKEEN